MKTRSKQLWASVTLLAGFGLWTVLLRWVDVRPIGPMGSRVGFATLNGLFHRFTGVHMTLYTVTDWLGLIPIGIALGFALLGLCQWIRRRRLMAVDRDIRLLGIFYLSVMAVFLLFEVAVVNYRPVLIEGVLEASYPSSTTLLVTCIMPTAMTRLRRRIRTPARRGWILWGMAIFTLLTVAGRLLSGVHWLTDIIGGGLVSGGLVLLDRFLLDRLPSDQLPSTEKKRAELTEGSR